MANVEARLHRKERIRKKLSGTSERPRLTVYKSLKHIHAQVIDDSSGKTLVAASSLGKELRGKLDDVDKTATAKMVGQLIAQKCLVARIEKVVFDRNGSPFHGRIAAVATGAREGGLKF